MPRVALATILPIIVFGFSHPARAQRQERDVIEMFTKAAAGVFERAKAKPSTDSAGLMRELIEQGASRLVSDRKTSNQELSAAVELIRRFAAEMVKHGVRQQDGTLSLGETSFAAAQRSLCPLYPFC